MRRMKHALVVAVTAVASLAVIIPDASAATVQAGTPYVLVNRNSAKALDVYNLATTDGAPINQYTRNDGAWQQWRFLDSGSGWYRVQSVHSGKVLDLPSSTDGIQLVQNADRDDARQEFRLAENLVSGRTSHVQVRNDIHLIERRDRDHKTGDYMQDTGNEACRDSHPTLQRNRHEARCRSSRTSRSTGAAQAGR